MEADSTAAAEDLMDAAADNSIDERELGVEEDVFENLRTNVATSADVASSTAVTERGRRAEDAWNAGISSGGAPPTEWQQLARRMSADGTFIELTRGRSALLGVQTDDPDAVQSRLPLLDGFAGVKANMRGVCLQVDLPVGYPDKSPVVKIKCCKHSVSDFLEQQIATFLQARKGQSVLRNLVRFVNRKIGEWSLSAAATAAAADNEQEQGTEFTSASETVEQQEQEQDNQQQQQQQQAEGKPATSLRQGNPWTLDEQVMLEKALIKFSVRMEKHKRWRLIGQFVRGRSKRECVDRFLFLQEFLRAECEPKIAAKQDSAVLLESETDFVSRDEQSHQDQQELPMPQWSAGVEDWTIEQQRALDSALLKYPSSMDKNERWKKIAKEVDHKSKRDCVERFKYLREQLLQQQKCGADYSNVIAASSAKESNVKSQPQDTVFTLPNLDPVERGVMATLTDLSVTNVGWCFVEKLETSCSCVVCSCDFSMTFVTINSSNNPAQKKRCPTCSTLCSIKFNPSLVHSASNGHIGFFDVTGAVVQDMISASLSLVCFECNEHTSSGPIHRDRNLEIRCHRCHTKLRAFFEGWATTDLDCDTNSKSTGKNSRKAASKSSNKRSDVRVVAGQPLPDNGACKHNSKSHRWLRFPCCGKVFPCDVCHEESANNDSSHSHNKACLASTWATRQICGFCSHEMPYSRNKSCTKCGKALGAASGSRHWEGGTGCRDKVMMSNKDQKKFSNSEMKTKSNKASRVGPKI